MEGPPLRRRLRIAGITLAAIVLLATALLARDIVTVRGAVEGAREELEAGLGALAIGQVGAAVEHLDAMDAHARRAVDATGRPTWRLMERAPLVDRSFHAARLVAETAAASTGIAVELASHAGQLTGEDGGGLRDDDGSFDFDTLLEVADGVVAVDTDGLEASLVRLIELPQEGIARFVEARRALIVTEGTRLLNVTQTVQRLAAVMPAFLGAEGPREYFVAMQNPGELRGTGGLIGFFATIRADRGELSLGDPERYEVLDDRGGVIALEDPPDVPPGFMDRYGHVDATTFLGNANLHPDLPTVAEVMLHLYESQRGRSLDGVIVIDPIGLAYAHAPIGPVEIHEGVFTGELPNPIPPQALARVLMIDVYDELGGDSPERKSYLEAVAESAFRGIATGDWSAIGMLVRLAQASAGGHVQIYSSHAVEQEAFRDVGIAGEMRPPQGMDFLAVTANNSAGNKSDVHVGHRISAEIRLDEPSSGEIGRDVDLRIGVENPLGTTGHDIYIIGSSVPGRGFIEAFTGPRGLNRTWFTVWAPDSTERFHVTNPDGRHRTDPSVTALGGLRAVDYALETPAESVRDFGVGVSGTAPVEVRPDGGVIYRLRWHRQAKAIPDRVDLRLLPPAGWSIRWASLEGGGGNTPLFGPDGEPGPPLTARMAGGMLLLRGDMTRAFTLEVVLVPEGEASH